MKDLLYPLLIPLLFTGFSGLQAQQEQPSPSPVASATPPPHQAPDVGAPKLLPNGEMQPAFAARHALLVERAKKGNIDVYFLGDSITQRWERQPELWKQGFGALKPGNFGIGGDHTQHVLWRIENGELTGVNPKVVVLMIGTNNAARDTPEDTARAITKIVEVLRTKLPDAKILLLGIFPRGPDAKDRFRKTNDQVNTIITKLDDGKHVFYLDIGPKFLQPDGTLSKEIMTDLVHPSPKGYQIWIDAMTPKLTELLN